MMKMSLPQCLLLLCRSDLAYKKAFADAGLHLVKEDMQLGFPPELYPVKM